MLDSDVLKSWASRKFRQLLAKSFLNLVSPEISLVSAGIKNKFDHPAKSVLASLVNLNPKFIELI